MDRITIVTGPTIFMGQSCWEWKLCRGSKTVASGTCATDEGARYAAEMERRLYEDAERPATAFRGRR